MSLLIERRPIAERFWDHVAQDSECWLWTGALYASGYGRISHGGRDWHCSPAHRVAWFIATGDWPPDHLDVCHTCDVRPCVRHDDVGIYTLDGVDLPRRGHLWLGTRAQNNRDKVLKGRQAHGDAIRLRAHPELAGHGERQIRAKLTWPQVDEIRARWAAGSVTQLDMSREYGVVNSLINEIISGKRWKFRLLSEKP